jgi:hypothetical protein
MEEIKEIIADCLTVFGQRVAVVYVDRIAITDPAQNRAVRTFLSTRAELQGVVVVLANRDNELEEPEYDGPMDVVRAIRQMGWIRLRFQYRPVTPRD